MVVCINATSIIFMIHICIHNNQTLNHTSYYVDIIDGLKFQNKNLKLLIDNNQTL